MRAPLFAGETKKEKENKRGQCRIAQTLKFSRLPKQSLLPVFSQVTSAQFFFQRGTNKTPHWIMNFICFWTAVFCQICCHYSADTCSPHEIQICNDCTVSLCVLWARNEPVTDWCGLPQISCVTIVTGTSKENFPVRMFGWMFGLHPEADWKLAAVAFRLMFVAEERKQAICVCRKALFCAAYIRYGVTLTSVLTSPYCVTKDEWLNYTKAVLSDPRWQQQTWRLFLSGLHLFCVPCRHSLLVSLLCHSLETHKGQFPKFLNY